MQITVVEQGEKFHLDADFLGKWTAEHLQLQLNVQVRAMLAAADGSGRVIWRRERQIL